MLWFGLKRKIMDQEERLDSQFKLIGDMIKCIQQSQALHENQVKINNTLMNRKWYGDQPS